MANAITMDAREIRSRLDFLGFTESDAELLRSLKGWADKAIPDLVKTTNPAIRNLLASSVPTAALRKDWKLHRPGTPGCSSTVPPTWDRSTAAWPSGNSTLGSTSLLSDTSLPTTSIMRCSTRWSGKKPVTMPGRYWTPRARALWRRPITRPWIPEPELRCLLYSPGESFPVDLRPLCSRGGGLTEPGCRIRGGRLSIQPLPDLCC